MPIIEEHGYNCSPLFVNGHVQTIYPTLFRPVPRLTYKRKRLDTPDGDFLDLDWSEVGSRSLAIVFHGLEGSADSKYMKGMIRTFNQRGWDGVAVNFRSCSGEPNLKSRSYHSGETGDMDFVVSHCVEVLGYKKIVLIGFSLGGNVTLKYLGEKRNSIRPEVIKAAAISVPCDLAACADTLGQSSNFIYMRRFMKRLKKKVADKKHLLPEDLTVKHMKTFAEFDDAVTAPIHGFKDAADYWSQCSSKQFISAIRVPTLMITAQNDPFLSQSCFPWDETRESDHVFFMAPDHGGHVGFVAFKSNQEYWHETKVVEFVTQSVLA